MLAAFIAGYRVHKNDSTRQPKTTATMFSTEIVTGILAEFDNEKPNILKISDERMAIGTPKTTPAREPTTLQDIPITVKIKRIEEDLVPRVFKIAISLSLVLTTMVSEERILKVATIIIRKSIRVIDNFSRATALKKAP